MSQSTVDFLYRTIVLTIAGTVAIVMIYLGYVLVFVGDGTRDELVHALSVAVAAAVSSPVILALIHQLVSAIRGNQGNPVSVPTTVSMPAMTVPVNVPVSAQQITTSIAASQAQQQQQQQQTQTPPALVPFPVPAGATPPVGS